ncbi:reticulon-4 isoform X2 [Acomys russatus]|uniref:reticulon-4 isoform X2 n=1 Tax=Acomys russatus TaxID=60746 RepID=UPI0021E28179|nr:reticulon-4 isoform X2 [Acomys russatus]
MEDLDQSPLVSSSADSPPRPPPAFKYQFVREPEDEEDEEEEEEEEEDDEEDLEELEVLERKPAAGLSAAPVPPTAAAAPLLDFGGDPVPPAPRGPLPAAPPAAPERQPSWERSPAAPAPSLPPAAAVLPSKLPEDDEPPARPPPSPPAGASPLAEPAAPPSTPAAPKRKGSGSVDETLFALPAASEPVTPSSAVVDLLYWRDIKKTGVVFGASLFLLLSLTVFSIVSVTAYIALALLSVTISFRIYKGVIQAIQKSDEGHPFRAYLESEVAVSEELVQKYSNSALGHVNSTIKELRRLFLVDDLVDSLKFAVLMWVFTYVGALFNGLTLLILALISLFSIPVIYERHQAQIDHYLGLANKSIKDAMAKIQAKIPGLKRKAE